jgi:hypothetical protein
MRSRLRSGCQQWARSAHHRDGIRRSDYLVHLTATQLGVPIPKFLYERHEGVVTTKRNVIDHIQGVIAEHGSEAGTMIVRSCIPYSRCEAAFGTVHVGYGRSHMNQLHHV